MRQVTGSVLAALLLILAAACGRDSVTRPGLPAGMNVRLTAAPRPGGAPALGPVDSLRFDLRGAGGELLVHPTRLAIEPGATTFSVSLAAPPGKDRSITVMGIGNRPVSGNPGPATGRGILYAGRASGIDVEPGNIPTVPVTLQAFVPGFLETEDGGVAGHTIHWTAVPNADRYVLRRVDGTGVRDTTIRGTSFTGHARPVAYQVRAMEFSGVPGAPSDWLEIQPILAPLLCVEPAAIDFGTSLSSATLSLTNCGTGGTVTWTVTEDIPWLSADVLQGSTTTESDIVTLTADRAGLAPGDHAGTVTIDSNAGSATVSVSLVVSPTPVLCASPDFLDFGASLTSLPFGISNCGNGGGFSWTLADDETWLSTAPGSGTTTTETDPVTVTVSRAGLPPGDWFGAIVVSSSAGRDTVTVSMTVPVQPALCVVPASLDFGTALAELPIFITNCGIGGTVNWSASANASWIVLGSRSGTVSGSVTTETDTVHVGVDRAGLDPGTYSGTVTVTSDAGSKTVGVSVVVPPRPALCVDTEGLAFGTALTQLSFHVTNCGVGGTVNWSATHDKPWLVIVPPGGATTESDVVTVTVSREGLADGVYQQTITVDSDAGQASIAVSMSVENPPALCVSADQLDFGVTTNQLSFDVTNCGAGGTLSWSLSGGAFWMNMTPGSGTSTGEADPVTVTVDRQQLDAGSYSAPIIVTSNAGSDTVRVFLRVAAVPVLCLSRNVIDFGTQVAIDGFSITNCGSGGSISWTLSDNQPWISVFPGEGTTTTEKDSVVVDVNRSAIPPGTHSGTVVVSSSSGTDTVGILVTIPGPQPPAAPDGLVATQIPGNPTLVRLDWVDHATDESGFHVERRDLSTGQFVEIGTVGPDTEIFSDQIGCGSFDYRVRAYNEFGDSPYSNTSNIVTVFCAGK